MKIVGTDGLDAQTVRQEVERGARFVLYTYCISLVVVTLKRPSNVYFIRPGQSRTIKGLPFALISLLLGWWGFPWGPIYTVQCLVNDLLGGKDVTDAVLASLPPAAAVAAGGSAAAATAPAPAAAEPSRARKIVAGVVIVGAIAASIVLGICLYHQSNLTVVLVSGAPKPYTVELNGTSHRLAPGAPIVLTLSEGDFKLTGGPRGEASPPQTFHFALPFFDHLSDRRVAVINPDRAAILAVETIVYRAEGASDDTGGGGDVTLYANEASYFLPAPDFVIEPFPQRIKMPQGSARTSRTRLTQVSAGGPAERANLLLERRGYPTMLRHVALLAAAQPEDEQLLQFAVTTLKPADARALLERHLGDRPVLVEWHRYYQDFAASRLPDVDLAAKYRGLLAAEPANGALRYLLARVVPDPAETHALFERALAASPPCTYAYNGLGVDALNAADFPRAVECFAAAEKQGLASETIRHNKRLARIAAGDSAGLLAEARARRQKAPVDLGAAEEEITCSLLAGLGRTAADAIKAEFLTRLGKLESPDPKERAMVDAYLSAAVAYGAGDEAGFAKAIGSIGAPRYAFQSAISRGDHAAAAAVLQKLDDSNSEAYLLCFLAAGLAGDRAAADAYFSTALQAMEREGREIRRIAAMLRQPALPEPAALNAVVLAVDQKRIVLAALAWRDPARQAQYAALARRMNFDPAFPRLLIERAVAAAEAHR